ncbi:MAG: HINT domain-containing protein [Marinifilaceae bacterium]|jgi:hypothetical protein|nr:HINT domain-containing protein [Marinifilaceae bacterium]
MFDHQKGRRSFGIVKRLFKRSAKQITKLAIAGSLLLSTPGHKIYSDGEYQSASELTTSSELLSSNGKHLHPSSVSSIDSTATVYNFEVSGYHNYYAGDAKVLVHNECAWVGIKQILVNSNKIELFDKFHDAVHALNIGSSERKLLFTSIANLDDNASKFILDFIDSPSKLSKFAKEAGLVEAWGVLKKNHPNLAKNIDILSKLKKLKRHRKFEALGLTEEMLAGIRGIDGVSYADMLEELEKVMDILPADKTSDFSKIIQTGQKRGLINNNTKNGIYDRRHSWLTLKTIIENSEIFRNAKSIEFEAVLQTIDRIPQSVPDIKLIFNERGRSVVKIGEIYAGKAGVKSNLASQSLTYFQEVNDLRDLRFFRRMNLSDKAKAKSAVIDAWKKGGVLDDNKVRELFRKFYRNNLNTNRNITKAELERLLTSNDDWFDLIFNSPF